MPGFLLHNLIRWMVMCVAIFIVAQMPMFGVHYDTNTDLFLAALILVLVNTFLRPIVMILSLPLIIFSMGLVLLVINAFMLLLVSWLLPGFHVVGFWSALFSSLVISLISIFLGGHWRWKKKVYRGSSSEGRLQNPPGHGEVIDI